MFFCVVSLNPTSTFNEKNVCHDSYKLVLSFKCAMFFFGLNNADLYTKHAARSGTSEIVLPPFLVKTILVQVPYATGWFRRPESGFNMLYWKCTPKNGWGSSIYIPREKIIFTRGYILHEVLFLEKQIIRGCNLSLHTHMPNVRHKSRQQKKKSQKNTFGHKMRKKNQPP